MMNGPPRFRTLGLLGGMGPSATADVLCKIIEVTPAARDQDHIPVLVRNVPQVPDRTQALLGSGASPQSALIAGARALRLAGADFLAIACNTAHHWYEPVREHSGLPVVHIADAVIHELHASQFLSGTIGMLATRGTLISGFYQRRLHAAGYRVLTPTAEAQECHVYRAIAAAKAGQWERARTAVLDAIEDLRSNGAERVLLACTELPAALGRAGVEGGALLDANMALARACVRAASDPSWTVCFDAIGGSEVACAT